MDKGARMLCQTGNDPLCSMKFDRMQIMHYDTSRVEKSILLRGEQLLRFPKNNPEREDNQ